MNNNTSTLNLLFDLVRLKCEIVFLNKSRYFSQCENIKQLLTDLFSTVEIKLQKSTDDEPNQVSLQSKRFYLTYNEREEIVDYNALQLSK